MCYGLSLEVDSDQRYQFIGLFGICIVKDGYKIKFAYSLDWECADYILDCCELASVIIKTTGLALDLSLGQTILYIASNKLRRSQ